MDKGLLTEVWVTLQQLYWKVSRHQRWMTSLVHPGTMQVGHVAHKWLKGVASLLGGDLVTLPTFCLEEINSWQPWSWWSLACRHSWPEDGILQNVFSGSRMSEELLSWFVLLEFVFTSSYKSHRPRPKEPHNIFEGCKSFSLNKYCQEKKKCVLTSFVEEDLQKVTLGMHF